MPATQCASRPGPTMPMILESASARHRTKRKAAQGPDFLGNNTPLGPLVMFLFHLQSSSTKRSRKHLLRPAPAPCTCALHLLRPAAPNASLTTEPKRLPTRWSPGRGSPGSAARAPPRGPCCPLVCRGGFGEARNLKKHGGGFGGTLKGASGDQMYFLSGFPGTNFLEHM